MVMLIRVLLKLVPILFYLIAYTGFTQSIYLSTGIGIYTMKDLKQVQQDVIGSVLVPAKIVDNFPPYLRLTGGVRLNGKRHFVGFSITQFSTGGRVSYTDNSGYLLFDQRLRGWNINMEAGYTAYSNTRNKLLFTLGAGSEFTKLLQSSTFVVGSNQVVNENDFDATNWFLKPSVEWQFKLGKSLHSQISVGYQFTIQYETLKLSKDNQLVLSSSKGPAFADWSGLRFAAGLNYQFSSYKEKERENNKGLWYLKVGVGWAKIVFEGEEYINFHPLAAIHFGGGYQSNFNDIVSLQTELNYLLRGGRIEYTPYVQGAVVSGTQEIRINYIDIPIQFKFITRSGSIKPYGTAGFALGVGLSGNYKEKLVVDYLSQLRIEENEGEVYFIGPGRTSDEGLGVENRLDLSATIGVGFLFLESLSVEVRKYQGLTSLYSMEKSKNRGITLSTMYYLKKKDNQSMN